MVKAVCSVWRGGKNGDHIKILPISIVYGIAITAMSFFTDPTIATLTSGSPSQNVDLAGFSFPRRIGFRLHPDYIGKYHLKGQQAVWECFADKDFSQSLGKKFTHDDMVDQAGWCRGYFEGIFENEKAYLKCMIKNMQTGQLIKTFYFEFTKAYQTSLDGRTYSKDPILDEKIVKNGVLKELVPDGQGSFIEGHVEFPGDVLVGAGGSEPKLEVQPIKSVIQHSVRYSEKSKMCFLVTPPHLMKYAKLILILLKQLVDLNFDQSYMTKKNQKPLYKTRFMLDELGNLQSEGHGISGFETMLSIGLGQEQQFSATCCQLKRLAGRIFNQTTHCERYVDIFIKSATCVLCV